MRCSPFQWIGPKRRHLPSRQLDKLPQIDIVLISHNHYDHLDKETVEFLHILYPDILWIVPKGVKSWFSRMGIHRVKELSWWEEDTIKLGKGKPEITIAGVPAQHNSGRTLFDMNRSLWLGYVLRFAREFREEAKYCYFVGDTAYNPYDFKKIGRTFPKIDLCLCPIGTYAPGTFMRTVHSHPKDAVAIHQDVGALLSVAMHWRTFKLSEEPLNRPPYDLFLEMVRRGLNPEKFLPLDPGEVINW
jgi:N-acyl-phosphatidylethanolamine-hydrolysing phospholipase D